jgi:transcriptional antiterminator NusG
LEKDTEDAPRFVVNFVVGEEVKLTDGPYASMRGRVEAIDEFRGKLKVTLTIFGRPVSTDLGVHQVEKIA